MNKCYINGVASITAQPTTNGKFLEDIISYNDIIFKADNPNYKDFIKPSAMRRMSKSVKMGVTASKMAMEQARLEMPDAIITGTGMGCRQDSEKFLEKILYDDEQFLTPTLFIQSTHNTVGGQIALGLQCKGYNLTYVQSSASFESSLIDAQLMLTEDSNKKIVVGGIDEIAKTSSKFHILNGELKQQPIPNLELLQSKTTGTLLSEGATFMVLDGEKSTKNIAEIVDIEMIYTASIEETKKNIEDFIARQGLKIQDIDAVILGNNGDRQFDTYYQSLQTSIFTNTQQLYYKHLIGDYHVASAFGYWLTCNIFKHNNVPSIVKMNNLEVDEHKNILLYNQYRGENHSIALVRKC